MSNYMRLFALFFLSMMVSQFSCASIVIDGTRVIYKGEKSEVTVSVTNKNNRPVLIQSWIDTGNENDVPEKISVPFVLTPPISRIDPEKGQTIRITYTGVPAIPMDRESVFWLNILEIQAKDKKAESHQQQLNIAFRTRVKLFYRPEGLEGTSVEAPNNLHWHCNGNKINVHNDSKYSITLFSIEYKNEIIKGKMILPGETQMYALKNGGDVDKIKFSVLNDYGAPVYYKAKN